MKKINLTALAIFNVLIFTAFLAQAGNFSHAEETTESQIQIGDKLVTTRDIAGQEQDNNFRDNARFTIPQGTNVTVTRITTFASGRKSIGLEIKNGNQKGNRYFIPYDQREFLISQEGGGLSNTQVRLLRTNLNARSSANFENLSNVVTVLYGTSVRFLEISSDGRAVNVEVIDGDRKGQKYWLSFDADYFRYPEIEQPEAAANPKSADHDD